MLSYEEKEALKNMKIFARVHPDMTIVTAKEMDIVVTLVEKQQKEIEKLKEKIINFTIEDEKIFLQFGEIIEKKRWKNKIKSKIEELKDGTYDAKIILQKLLEE